MQHLLQISFHPTGRQADSHQLAKHYLLARTAVLTVPTKAPLHQMEDVQCLVTLLWGAHSGASRLNSVRVRRTGSPARVNRWPWRSISRSPARISPGWCTPPRTRLSTARTRATNSRGEKCLVI
jgi:hypothetical protein